MVHRSISFRILVLSTVLFLVLSTLFPITVSAGQFWSEDFEVDNIDSLDDWILQGYELVDDVFCEVDHGFTIENGTLTAEDVYYYWPNVGYHGDLTHLRRAIHNSSTAYGTWSFDWHVSSSNVSFDSVNFVYTDLENNYNLSGVSQVPNMDGYALILDSFVNGEIYFELFQGLERYILARHPIITRANEVFHFEIIRDLPGQFQINLNSELVIEITDDRVTTSETFSFVSFQGNSSIDNIVVSDSIEGALSDQTLKIVAISIGISIVVIVIVILLKRKT
ncbi:MAG: hypothetical protein ACFFCF_01200 [Promethearchaeota archaeon]